MRGLWQLVVCGLFVIGCGGGDSPPKPLSKRFDDMHIARIPLDQKGSVVETQNQWSIAKMENANAEANLQEADSQLHQAKNDHKAAKLAVDSAISAKKSAEQSADMNRINSAQADLRKAEDSAKAAEARVKYFDAYRAYLKKWHRYTQENMYWREAQYENAKADLAKRNNIQPKGIVYDDFQKQLSEREKRTNNSKGKAESEKNKAVSARQNWLSAQQVADKGTGRTGAMYDPMAPTAGGPTTAGGGISQEQKPQVVQPLSSNPQQPTPAQGPTPEYPQEQPQ
jgi:multidrug efflux pump subunit AcrA (membrane-fusion protein)